MPPPSTLPQRYLAQSGVRFPPGKAAATPSMRQQGSGRGRWLFALKHSAKSCAAPSAPFCRQTTIPGVSRHASNSQTQPRTARSVPSGGRGRGFESRRPRQFKEPPKSNCLLLSHSENRVVPHFCAPSIAEPQSGTHLGTRKSAESPIRTWHKQKSAPASQKGDRGATALTA